MPRTWTLDWFRQGLILKELQCSWNPVVPRKNTGILLGAEPVFEPWTVNYSFWFSAGCSALDKTTTERSAELQWTCELWRETSTSKLVFSEGKKLSSWSASLSIVLSTKKSPFCLVHASSLQQVWSPLGEHCHKDSSLTAALLTIESYSIRYKKIVLPTWFSLWSVKEQPWIQKRTEQWVSCC